MGIKFHIDEDSKAKRECYTFTSADPKRCRAGHVDDDIRNEHAKEYAAFKAGPTKEEKPSKVAIFGKKEKK